MSSTKRGHAINGDLFTIRHSDLELDVPFTSFIDVSFQGVTHQAFVAADRSAFSYANATGEFTVAGFPGHVLEVLDTVETQVRHRYQAVVATPTGALSIHSYEDVEHLLSLIGSLGVQTSKFGVTLNPDAEIEYTTAPRVALTTDIGVVEITPLTAEVIDQLPDWTGTAVGGGQLYGGRFSDEAAYLTLVTKTCRVAILPGAAVDEDMIAATAADLHVEWST